MKKITIWAYVIVCFFYNPVWAFDYEHNLFNQDLKLYVHNGLVDYQNWQKHQENLNLYIKELAQISNQQLAKLSLNDQKALWINAYNAFTIHLVLQFYPIQGSIAYFPKNSIRQIYGIWDDYTLAIAGKRLSISELEHDILRTLQDPRLHFVVNPATRDGGKLASKVYLAPNLDQELDLAQANFFIDKANLLIDDINKKIYVSRIFKWFPLDFACQSGCDITHYPAPTDQEIVFGYIKNNAPVLIKDAIIKKANYQIEFLKYNWSLNEFKSDLN